MVKLMRKAKGIGLAAESGLDKRMCVICVEDRYMEIVGNLEIIKKRKTSCRKKDVLACLGLRSM